MNPFEQGIVEVQKNLKHLQGLYEKTQAIINEQQEEINKLREENKKLKDQSVYAVELQIKAKAWDNEQSLNAARLETERQLTLLKKH